MLQNHVFDMKAKTMYKIPTTKPDLLDDSYINYLKEYWGKKPFRQHAFT
jgi:hypothetical protein